MRARDSLSSFSCELYNTPGDVDEGDWNALIDPDDWGMDLQFLALEADALRTQAKVQFVLVRDSNGLPAACSAIAVFRTGPFEEPLWAERLARSFGLRPIVLFCGLPVPCGSHHLRIRSDVDPEPVMKALDSMMARLAKRLGAQFVVFKELDEFATSQLSSLPGLGYRRGGIPASFVLHGAFGSLEQYRNHLRAGYRRQFDVSRRKMKRCGIHTQNLRGSSICQTFTDQIHQLYVDVRARSADRLEKLPSTFFSRLPTVLGDRVLMTVLYDRNTPRAFAYGVIDHGTFHNLYVGVDYDYRDAGHLYFNVFFESMAFAWAEGAQEIVLGQTSETFKSRLGARPYPLFYFVRPCTVFGWLILNALGRWIAPDIKSPIRRRVFRTDTGPGSTNRLN